MVVRRAGCTTMTALLCRFLVGIFLLSCAERSLASSRPVPSRLSVRRVAPSIKVTEVEAAAAPVLITDAGVTSGEVIKSDRPTRVKGGVKAQGRTEGGKVVAKVEKNKTKKEKKEVVVEGEEMKKKKVVVVVVEGQEKKKRIRRELGFPLIYATLCHYKMLYGNLLVPVVFVVPSDGWGWPEASWGVKLGITCQTIRSGCYADKRKEFLSIGFVYDVYGERFQKVRAALKKYKEMHGDLLVPQGMVIPTKSDLWPKALWGLKLGTMVHSIRTGTGYLQYKEELLEMGFDYSSQLRYRYEAIKMGLLRYKALHGDMIVPKSFIVPSDTEDWPKETWGIKLGVSAHDIREGYIYRTRQAELRGLGFYDS